MQSRKSIPNVGRRAQGRKTLFMLKGNGVSYPSSEDPAEAAAGGRSKWFSRKQGSLTSGVEGGGGELGDPPVTYDESVLSQPSHPYNRIIQRILLRHQAAERKDLRGTTLARRTAETDCLLNQVLAANSAPPHARSNRAHCPALSHHTSASPPTKTDPREDDVPSSNTTPEEAESSTPLQWADILRAEHCSGQGDDASDARSCTLSSPEDRSVFSLDLAKGYLTDRGLISDRSHDGRDVHDGLMDTTRSEPNGVYSLPRLARKRDLQPLDDVLDYFWVYQGMSRQLLDRRSPDHLWNKELFQKKPVKLPPLGVATRRKVAPTSPDSTSSVPFSRVSSEEADTPGETPREEGAVREKMCELKSLPGSGSPSSERSRVQGNEVQTPAADSDVSDGNDDDDEEEDDNEEKSCQNESLEEKCAEKGRGRRVILVVKMPVLTHETSSSDLLDND